MSLPAYVSSLVWSPGLPQATVWTTGTTDTRALAPDPRNQGLRNAASYYNAPDMPFTVNTTGTNYYQVALYFVDWDHQSRQLAVEMFDAKTLDLIAPVRVATNFSGGKYLVYRYNKSVRFRFDQVRGANAPLSGIFFDPAPAVFQAAKLGEPKQRRAYRRVRGTAAFTPLQLSHDSGLEVCGDDGTAGATLVYTLPAATYGQNITNITVYGGWQDSGRDAQEYTVYYSTVANPEIFIGLTSVSYFPANPGSAGDTTRVVISDAAGAILAQNVAALKF
jgi:hypothetical protein